MYIVQLYILLYTSFGFATILKLMCGLGGTKKLFGVWLLLKNKYAVWLLLKPVRGPLFNSIVTYKKLSLQIIFKIQSLKPDSTSFFS